MIYPPNFASRPGPPPAVHIELDLLGIGLYGGLLGSQGLKIAVGPWGSTWDKNGS